MAKEISIEEIIYTIFSKYSYNELDLDYSVLPKHIATLQALSDIGNTGINVFDINKLEVAFFSANFGKALGYSPSDYAESNHRFFDQKIHPDDRIQFSLNSISILKIFDQFSRDEKLNHKSIYEYRMLNSQGKYIRLIEQYQVLELDKKGQLWLLFGIVDISPNQEETDSVKSQLLNFRTGTFIPLTIPQKPELDLTKRELEILKLVRDGFLSKEISDKLSISVHTVNTHRQRFLEKLGANNSIEAVVFASKFGLLD
jgi:DNA-binding CsgD family transcriptional regulator